VSAVQGSSPYATKFNQQIGDILGVLLDFDSGVMSYTLNGSSMGKAFSKLEHGSNPIGDALIPGTCGCNWDLGFYPAITIGAGESVSVNFGQYPFLNPPSGYQSVYAMHLISCRVIREHVLSYRLYSLSLCDTGTKWTELCASSNDKIKINGFGGTFCSLLPSLRIAVALPIIIESSAPSKSELRTFTSNSPLTPRIWSFCVIRCDLEKQVLTFYIDGFLDAEFPLEGTVISDKWNVPVGVCVAPQDFEISNVSKGLWIADFRLYRYVIDDDEVSRLLNSEPSHKSTLRTIWDALHSSVDALGALKQTFFSSNMENLASIHSADFNDSWRGLNVLLTLSTVDIENVLSDALGMNGIEAVSQIIIRSLSKAYSESCSVLSCILAEMLGILSASFAGRLALIRSASLLKIISLVPRRKPKTEQEFVYRFWLEIIVSNLHLEDYDVDENTSLELYSKLYKECKDSNDIIFFRKFVTPFQTPLVYPLAWAFMPFGVWVRVAYFINQEYMKYIFDKYIFFFRQYRRILWH